MKLGQSVVETWGLNSISKYKTRWIFTKKTYINHHNFTSLHQTNISTLFLECRKNIRLSDRIQSFGIDLGMYVFCRERFSISDLWKGKNDRLSRVPNRGDDNMLVPDHLFLYLSSLKCLNNLCTNELPAILLPGHYPSRRFHPSELHRVAPGGRGVFLEVDKNTQTGICKRNKQWRDHIEFKRHGNFRNIYL